MGAGPHLGMAGKYELFLLPSEGAHTDYLRTKVGLTTKTTQRWCHTERDTLAQIIHTDQAKLRVDEALHGHVIFCISQNLALGYKHYSYELPIWIQEGLAHWFEREINPRFNSFTSSEGGTAEKTSKEDWKGPVLKLVNGDKTRSFASVTAIRTFAELKRDDHLVLWSLIDFLMQEHPTFLPIYMRRLSGLMDSKGYSDGSDLTDLQRDVFKKELNMTYGQFENAWKAWVQADM